MGELVDGKMVIEPRVCLIGGSSRGIVPRSVGIPKHASDPSMDARLVGHWSLIIVEEEK